MSTRMMRNGTCLGAALVAAVLAVTGSAGARPDTGAWSTAYQSYASKQSVSVGAVVRKFTPGANADFGKAAGAGGGRYINIMADSLDANGKPVFRSTGQKVTANWKDAAGQAISPPRSYIAAKSGDVAGAADTAAGGAVTSADTLGQWFRDVPGVNTSTRSSLAFTRNSSSGLYVFDGSLDSLSGTPSYAYTTEVEYPFVYEAGKSWYFDAVTDAEAFVFVDGRLVIDGGRGGDVPFTITNGTVVPSANFNATVTVLGAAIASGTHMVPVTAQVRVGSTVSDPFGVASKPISSNLNDNKNPRNAVVGTNVPANTAISVIANSWLWTGSSPNYTNDTTWAKYITVDSKTGSAAVKVLRNGDAVPNIVPFANQATISSFLTPYLNATTRKVTLAPNQAIYLFELGTTNLTSTAADFQDLVVLVSLTGVASSSGSGSSGSSAPVPVPQLSERIDLDRLALDDRSSHKIKILFANRTGAASHLRLDTNIQTLNVANRRSFTQQD